MPPDIFTCKWAYKTPSPYLTRLWENPKLGLKRETLTLQITALRAMQLFQVAQ